MIISYLESYLMDEAFDMLGLDVELPYEVELTEGRFIPPDTPVTFNDVTPGDIFWAKVYQENAQFKNLEHEVRPFLIISKSASKVYGVQITHRPSPTMGDLAVPIENFSMCGLPRFSYIMPNMIRGVYYHWLSGKIGHITPEVRQDLIDKLKDFKSETNPTYQTIPIRDRLDQTIENVYKIVA